LNKQQIYRKKENLKFESIEDKRKISLQNKKMKLKIKNKKIKNAFLEEHNKRKRGFKESFKKIIRLRKIIIL